MNANDWIVGRLMLRAFFTLSIGMIAGAAPAPGQAQTQGPAPASQSQPSTAPAAFVRPQAPGRLIDVGGHRLHILCKGVAAGPTVIFEAGLSQYTANSTYGSAQDAIAPFARVCTRTYPHDVAGLILLDATSDEDFDELAAAAAATIPQLNAAIGASRPGLPVVGMPAGTSPEVVMAFTPELLRGVKTEFEALDRLPAEMKRPGGFGDLGHLPLIVVRRGKTAQPPSEADLRHQRVQENLAKLSTNSALIVAQNSGHTIPLDEPGVVADAVRRMLDARRSKGD